VVILVVTNISFRTAAATYHFCIFLDVNLEKNQTFHIFIVVKKQENYRKINRKDQP